MEISMNPVTWSILGLIVVLLGLVWREWRRQLRTAVPDAVLALRARHAAPEPDEPTPDEEPATPEPDDVPAPKKHSRDIFGRVGADAHWAEELAAVGDGQLLPEGIPTVSIDEIPDAELVQPGKPTKSIDDFTDWEIWEASMEADIRRCDNALEAARRLCTANLVAAGIPLAVMQELDRRDLDVHERAVDHATVLTTTELRMPTSTRPHKPDCGPRARRDRKRANKALGR